LPKVYFIAGPPGVGKSTSGGSFLPGAIDILDPDRIAGRYKAQGFADYKDIGNIKFNDLVRKQLFAGNDFAIELNLGFESHYDFLKSIRSFNNDNTIEVILFFTEDIKLCYQRTEQRHQEGLHYVSPETI
jgi:predicted ABC-type ATPase